MIVFHGSENIIEKRVYGYGKKYNDYGLGFYCTEILDLAKEWAADLNRDGFANQYEIDTDTLQILDLNANGYGVLHWISILLKNRVFPVNSPIAMEAKKYLLENFLPEYEKYDIVRGYRADDSYFSFASDFINNTISLQQLEKAMKFGDLGEQIVLRSAAAFDHVTFLDASEADADIWYPRKAQRDEVARRKYYDMDKQSFRKGEMYILRILEEEIKADDVRLR